MKQPNPEAKLKELEAVSSWQRAEFIEKGGWDKMPGKQRLTTLSPGHAPMGLNFFSRNDCSVFCELCASGGSSDGVLAFVGAVIVLVA
jgi:hypothetical protein